MDLTILTIQAQIKGRTARQGSNGSFSMVLLESELEPFGMDKAEVHEIKNGGKLFLPISENRDKQFLKRYDEQRKNAEDIERKHKKSEIFRSGLINPSDDEILREFLVAENRAPKQRTTRTIVLMDATGSMSSLIEKSKMAVRKMFEEITKIGVMMGSDKQLLMQLVVYRNYNCQADEVLQISPW